MRKLLLSFLAVVGIALAGYADSVTFDFKNNEYGMVRLSGTTQQYNPAGTVITQENCPVEITPSGNTRLWSDGLRFYKDSSIKITAPGYVIKSVTFGQKWESFNYNGSALSKDKWSSAAGEASVEFACNIAKSNIAVNTLTIEYEKAGDPDKEDAGIKFNETVFSIELGDEFTAPALVNPNGLAVTYTSSDEAVATVAADGKVDIVGPGTTIITAKSEETDKFNSGSAEYTLTVIDVLLDAADVYSLAKGDMFVLKEPLTVFYVNGQNVYAAGANRNLLLYNGTKYEVGTVIKRLEGKVDVYNGLVEVINYSAETEVTGATVAPKAMNVADISSDNINDYIIIDNADITAFDDKGNGTIEQNGATVALYNKFKLTDVSVAQGLKITGILGIYGTNIQLQPIVIDVTTGIEEINADNASAEYFNMQGIKVAENAKGLLIRRQGDKVDKIVVR